MTHLILSDIHSNFDALEAVLADAKGRYDSILALGDMVGYGAEPNKVLDWARENVAAVVRGNHDKACAGGSIRNFNPAAGAAAMWTRSQLTPANAAYLKALPAGPLHQGNGNGGFDLAHGSPRDEDQYLTSTWEARSQMPLASPVTFFGHTHYQGGFRTSRNEALVNIDRNKLLRLSPRQSYLVNPGSVGQPRDGDPRAAYALYDPEAHTIAFHRVAYDIEAAAGKILATGVPGCLAERLRGGR